MLPMTRHRTQEIKWYELPRKYFQASHKAAKLLLVLLGSHLLRINITSAKLGLKLLVLFQSSNQHPDMVLLWEVHAWNVSKLCAKNAPNSLDVDCINTFEWV